MYHDWSILIQMYKVMKVKQNDKKKLFSVIYQNMCDIFCLSV